MEAVEDRPTKGGKSIKSLPVKEKKPPSEKQLAAREKLRLARLEKIAAVKAEKAKLEDAIRLKSEEVERKKQELAEKRRLRREEKKKLLPQKPVQQSEPGKVGEVEDLGPSIGEALKSLEVKAEEEVEEQVLEEEEEEVSPESPKRPAATFDPRLVMAPKREYHQRFRSYPIGKSIPAKPRFR